MATTAVLRPRDCGNSIPYEPEGIHAARFVPRAKPAGSRKPISSPNSRQKRQRSPPAAKQPAPVMGEVRILKRGENLSPNLSPQMMMMMTMGEKCKTRSVRFGKQEDVVLCSTKRLGPDPKVVREKLMVVEDRFAGNLWVTSPPPSQVPMPTISIGRKARFDLASVTVDLHKILRLVPTSA